MQPKEIEMGIESQTPSLDGLHQLHRTLMPPSFSPQHRPLALPSVVGDRYRAQQAAAAAAHDLPDDHFFEGDQYWPAH